MFSDLNFKVYLLLTLCTLLTRSVCWHHLPDRAVSLSINPRVCTQHRRSCMLLSIPRRRWRFDRSKAGTLPACREAWLKWEVICYKTNY